MPYKCEYDESETCGNCKHEQGGDVCRECSIKVGNACPLVQSKKYPEGRKICNTKCLFEHKEDKRMRCFTAEEAEAHKRVLKKLSIDTGVNVMDMLKESEGNNMIMTEEEMDEQIAMYEAEEAKRLKQCKCGGEAKVAYIGTYGDTYYEVKCKKCGRTTAVCGSEKKAIEEWNANVADLGVKKKREAQVAEPNCCIKDSGERREFETGAVEIEIDLTKVRNAKKIRIVVAD